MRNGSLLKYRSFWTKGISHSAENNKRLQLTKPFIMHMNTHKVRQHTWVFFFHYSPTNSMTNWAQMFTGLLFCAYVEIHQVKILIVDNYQTCPVPLNRKTLWTAMFLLEAIALDKNITFLESKPLIGEAAIKAKSIIRHRHTKTSTS